VQTSDAGALARPVDRRESRDALIEQYLPNARAVARRFHRHGEPLEDLVQVAIEGLLLAIDRFDASRGAPFVAYANATMVGTVKRHYRDRGWAVRVPRRVHDLAGPIKDGTSVLEQDLGREPTAAEVADLLGIRSHDVDEVLMATQARHTRSIDADNDLSRRLSDPVDAVESGMLRSALRAAILGLPDDARYVLVRYYEDGRTQTEIGAEIGRSQMHVSRTINRSIAALRAAIA
jgi:RNA polymerase sigma-B factor